MSEADILRCVGAFRDQCRAKDYRYADPDSAFANCVRGDWQGCRTKGATAVAGGLQSFGVAAL
jgi:hypothetical protein